jgi:hypothetical protein
MKIAPEKYLLNVNAGKCIHAAPCSLQRLFALTLLKVIGVGARAEWVDDGWFLSLSLSLMLF